jgi:hypothetical protein
MNAVFDIEPRRELDFSAYLIATLGRDAWKKGLEAVLGELALLATSVFLVVARLQSYLDAGGPGYQEAGSSSRLDRLPLWLVIVLAGVCLLAFVVLLRPTLMYVGPPLHIRVADTWLGRGYMRNIEESTADIETVADHGFTDAFYYRVRKRFEHVRFRDDAMLVGRAPDGQAGRGEPGDSEDRIEYRRVYKVFLAYRKRFMVLRCTWKRGPRDVIVDLSPASGPGLDGLLRFLGARLSPDVKRYGRHSGLLGPERHAPKRYDPWECWSYQKLVRRKGSKSYMMVVRARWKGWRLPPDAPLRGRAPSPSQSS